MAEKIKLPVGYFATFGGQFENLQAAKNRLAVAVPVALALIFLLLFFAFGSLKTSALIFTAIPLSAIGGVFALAVRGMPFSISAGVGFIALFGVAVLNGIVLLAEFKNRQKMGETDLQTLILEATDARLRPVLMTAFVASLGFLPMALSNGSGAEVQRPLATVVIGGLISATFLTLFVLPCLFVWFEKWGKPRVPKAVVVVVLSLFFFKTSVFSQKMPSPENLTLEQAIDLAKQNNGSLKIENLKIEQANRLVGAAREVPKTNVEAQFGQFNSIEFDQQLAVSQSIPNRKVWKTGASLAEANAKTAVFHSKMTENELVFEVKTTFDELLFLKTKARRLDSLDSVFQNFVRAADLRAKTGEAAALEKLMAESQLAENRNARNQVQSDLAARFEHLKMLLNTRSPLEISTSILEKRPFPNQFSVEKNPLVAFYFQKAEAEKQAVLLEKARLLPQISIGYSNTSFIGLQNVNGVDKNFKATDRFHAAQIGVAVPIFKKAEKSKIEAAQLGEAIAANEADFQNRRLEGQLAETVLELQKQKATLDFYEKTALPTAAAILKKSETAFRAGEIGYVEFLAAVRQSREAFFGFDEAVLQLNRTVFLLEFLTAN